ncbi:hypothetical protein GPECTOR_4g796 [Gonium pectorale]|uniref:Fibrocystin-L n=1 Tax=Gonium pectorale TaxID=33097 RepID=A0A150GXV3_GONPE|nr:hypothetical protein GPECTOR_4g796 [Gonium pectorale]|eukprot:KXZ54727.1 hypothetical protein GPECTOR_4g796 [Gonium pectorale]
MGSSRLTIYGRNFGDYYTTSPAVFVGQYPCTIIGHYSSSEVVTCETSPGLVGTYIVTVVVGEDDPVSVWGFSYTGDYTPTLQAVVPSAGPPGSPVFLYGDYTWTLRYRDCVATDWGELGCVGSITFGDYLCRMDVDDENSAITFNSWDGYNRYGYSAYRVGCTLPAPDKTNTQPAIGTAGSVNATLRFEASMRGGNPSVLRESYEYDVDGKPYHFQLYAEVADISPSVGSMAGGTLVKISGRGFPTLELGLGDRINVSISGVPCAVINSTYDAVFCVTGPKPVTLPADATPIRGQYPGMRGVEYEFYNVTSGVNIWFSQLWRLNTTITINNTLGTGSYKGVVTDVWEDPEYPVPYHCSRMKAFFTAPRSGPYRFYMASDDFGQVNATWLQDGFEVKQMIINSTTWNYVNSYFQYTFQSSAPIYLAAKQRILLESAHCNQPAFGTQQLAVRMPVPEPRANSLAEVQTVTVTSSLTARQLLVKVLYGAGANTTAYFVNITSLDDSKLEDPTIGLELTFNGGSPTVVFPLTATSAAMDDIVEAAFGDRFTRSANNDLFGIRKIRSHGTLALQVGINALIGEEIGFDVTMARLVMVANSTLNTFNTNCTLARPGRFPSPPPPPPAPLPDVPVGMMVAVSASNPVPAVTPGGEFYLGLPNTDEPLLLSYFANVTEMRDAIYNQTGYYPSVSISSTWREGAYFAKVWTITFPTSALNNVPNIAVAPSETTPPGVLLTTEVRPAGATLSGSFKLAYGDYCESVAIGLTDSAETVKAKLGALPGMSTPYKVETSGSIWSGYTFRITFDVFGSPGDQPPLRVTDVSGLTGVSPTVTVTTDFDGSTDAFYAPIPTEFLTLAVAQPGSISLVVNGAPSACAHPSGICKFEYSEAATPRITGVSPTSLAFDDEVSLPLTITGTRFDAGALNVTVGTSVCNVTSFTATQIVCSIQDSAPAGIRTVNVNVAGLGDAAGAVSVSLETLFVTGTTPAPAVVASAGLSILNITGKGFDRVNCANNRVFIDGLRCGVLACGRTFATVLYPGNGGSDVAAAPIKAQVFELGRVIDEDAPASPTIRVLGSAPTIMGVTSPMTMPASGGDVTVSLSWAGFTNVVAMYMVPEIEDPTNFTASSNAYKGRLQCLSVTVADGGVTCRSPSLKVGEYHVMVVLNTGVQLLSSETILFDMAITSITPNAGSIGGGTVVTITGYGFSSIPAENVVFITVPVSSTFLNGIIQCRTLSATVTKLTCVTLPHLATNADADDPFARKVMPVATLPNPVNVFICDQSYNLTILLEYCSTLTGTARARLALEDGATATFAYSTVLTPSIDGISPSNGAEDTVVEITGTYLDDVATVQLLQGGVVRGTTADVNASSNSVSVVMPDLPTGVYTMVLRKANGEGSVDPYSDGVFTYTPIILAMSSHAGSVVGGRPLTLTIGGSGLAVGSASPGGNATSGNNTAAAGNATALNSVSIGGLPCPVVAVHDRNSLTCIPSGMNGYVLAEYWNLGTSTQTLPDLQLFDNPVLSRLEKGINFNWGTSSPLPGAVQADYFGARFTFYLQNAANEAVAFYLRSDDRARLYVDDEFIGNQWTSLSTNLSPGVHKIMVTYVEWTGYAYLQLQVSYMQDNGYMSSWASPEWQKMSAVPPGRALPVKLTVNGVEAQMDCPATTVALKPPYLPAVSYEPATVNLPGDVCTYVYATQLTPTLVSLKPMALGGVTTPVFTAPNANISIYGQLLLNPSLPATPQLNITIGNQSCIISDVSTYVYNATLNTTRVNCTLPPLPVGTWPISILVDNVGLTRPPASITTDLPVVTYTVQINSITSPPSTAGTSQCHFSMFGGGTLGVSGYGLPRGVLDNTTGRAFTPVWEQSSTCNTAGENTPPCLAAKATLGLVSYPQNMTLNPLSSDGQNATIRLSRFRVSNPELYAGVASARASVRYRARVTYLYPNSPQFEQAPNADPLWFCGSRTPALSAISPASVAPDAGVSAPVLLTLTWTLTGVGSSIGLIATAPTDRSNATVDLEVGNVSRPCVNATVTTSTLTTSSYTETLRCYLPSYLPAASYTLWICIQPFGCGLSPAYTVPLTVNTATPLVGSSAGGILVTLSGNGFDTNVSRVAVRFGSSPCNVTSSDGKILTCVTTGLDAKPASPVTAPLSIIPTTGADEVTLPAFTFTFDPALETTVASITPARGSTEGGTPVTITGLGFAIGVATTVTIGQTPCSSVVVVSSTSITCTTGKPPSDVLRSPLPVTVFQEGRGNGRGSVNYQYIDLWSRNSTWGGGPLPGFEDSVVIPAGITVLLDMSPPKLFIVVLQGNLIFDETQPYINLQAHYILVMGGNFTIGSAAKPFPGRANITMHGPPHSRDLPMYGAKALAVRQGVVTFFGQPKLPHYTTLNSTVDPGATSITVNGAVNWQVGDRIVIASSSFYANEVSEATLTAIDTSSKPGCSVLSLDTPTKYVHLGEIHSQPGVAVPLDMRTEVAVLTRNILLTGDWNSAKTMYGVQVMVNSPRTQPRALIRFDNMEVAQSGQAFRLGRYSIHWHMHGDVNYQSWVRGCSIHHTYNRATTIHGTHRVLYQNNVAYNVMGHAFFLEDGIESGNIIEGNLGIYTRTSDALLNTDTTPATFWITNPNNTVRHNRAAGSLGGYGFWYRMLDNPEGPSFTTTICPKFTPLVEFSNNTAHSNMFYGLRIHPEYYPRNTPCNGFSSPFAQQPAVFNGLTAYKNGMKGAVGTQLGLVQWTNFVAGDNGGGPKAHIVNGKDHGGQLEMSWITDDRNRYDVALTEMASIANTTVYTRTSTGNRGNAGAWPSGRRIAGIITQSPVLGDSKHSALMSLVNVTFVDYTASSGMTALEHCGKCKTFQGGATTFTANISFVNSDGSKPVLSFWSWGHQGIFLDTDGTLLNSQTLPASLVPGPSAGWSLGPGATWHSAVESELFDPEECVYVRGAVTSNNGAFCSPALTFRRVMLNQHGPEALFYNDLRLTSLKTNRTSIVHFTNYNELGYQFTVATGRDYWVHWAKGFRLDPEAYRLHKMDLMDGTNLVYVSSKYIQVKDHFKVNSAFVNSTALPPPLPSTPHGSYFYDKNLTRNTWWWGNYTYNDTKFTMLAAGRYDSALYVRAYDCPDQGCEEQNVPPEVVDVQTGTFLWSNVSTWANRDGGKPVAGDNVTIPFGWDLILDESPPALGRLFIQGSVRFDPTKDVNLTATYIVVTGRGVLRAGSASVPHPTSATIKLVGGRATPDLAIDNSLNLGSKVLAAIRGGTIDLYGREVGQRWIRLNAAAKAGDTSITVSDPNHGWRVGDKILVTSTTFNVWQSEMRRITEVRNNGSVLALDSPLQHPHGATVKAYSGGPTVDMRAEVGLISSNIVIAPENGAGAYGDGSEYFGARVVVSGSSIGRLSNIAMEYCGQAGFTDRACVLFDRLGSITITTNDTSTGVTTTTRTPNPSVLRRSALLWGLNSNVRVAGTAGATDPATVSENVLYESYDNHGVEVLSTGNVIKSNLVVGTIKDMVGKATMDILMPSGFKIWSASNWVENNIAAGSERYGFTYYGPPCSEPFLTGSFLNNTAHSCLAGMWLQSSNEAMAEGCTALRNFTTYMNWDFGIISTRGLPTNLVMENVNVLDTKHSGVTVFGMSGFTTKNSFVWRGGLLVGQSSDDTCKACTRMSDAGCHKKLSRQSYNQGEPFSPALGLQSAMFALGWAVGPEKKPYDKPMGYSVVHGYFNISGVTLADFYGPTGCGGGSAGTYALANHPMAPEAFYPHFFSRMNVINVASGPAQGMFFHTPPDPGWRNEADCGEAVYTREDGTEIPLNCAGPAHAHWRDLDGSLIAGGDPSGAGTIAGIFTQPRVFPMDQGSPVLPGACTYSSVYDSYRCGVGSTTFLLDERLKPKPIPPAGIWGDPQHFVLESRDGDSEDRNFGPVFFNVEDRNFGPVFFNVSGSIDLVTAAMDHGWCFAYTCQKRLSTFWTYLPSFQTVRVNFTGTPSQNFRLWYPYADAKAELVLVINMLYTLNRRFVWLAPGNGPVSGRIPPETKPVAVGDGTGHGAHYWDQDNSLLYVKILGGKSLEIRTENAIMITQSFSLTVDQFYNTGPLFLTNLASAMGIDPSRIYIAKIVPGSATLTTAVGPSWDKIGPIPEPQLSGAFDGSDGASAPPPPPPSPYSSTLSVSDLLSVITAYTTVMNNPDSLGIDGLKPLGPVSVDLGALNQQDPLFAQQLAAAAAQLGITSSGKGETTPDPPPPPAAAAPPPSPPPATTVSPAVDSPPPASSTASPSPIENPQETPGPVVIIPGIPGGDPVIVGVPERLSPPPSPPGGANGNGRGVNGAMIGGLVAAVVGALVIGGVVAAAIVMRKRRRSQVETRPALPSFAENAVVPAPLSPAAAAAAGGSEATPRTPREGFSVTNPAYEPPREQERSQHRDNSDSGDGTEGRESGSDRQDPAHRAAGGSAPGTRPGSGTNTPRRASALAAGSSGPSVPELLRPLVSTSKHPHHKPLVDGGHKSIRPEVYKHKRVKVPAALGREREDSEDQAGSLRNMAGRLESMTASTRNIAGRANSITYVPSVQPGRPEDWEAEDSDVERLVMPTERIFKSVTAMGEHRPGHGRPSRAGTAGVDLTALPPAERRVHLAPIDRPNPSTGGAQEGAAAGDASGPEISPVIDAGMAAPDAAAATAPDSAAVPVQEIALASEEAGGAATSTPVARTFDTQESFRPRSRAVSRAASRAPSATAAGIGSSALVTAGHDEYTGEEPGPELEEEPRRLPGPAPEERPVPAAPRPTMMLPGGMLEFAATPSLLRSDVAALLLSAGDGAQGFAALEEILQEAQQQQQAGTPQARSPAGLFSESMRRREQAE